ncbi:hypothetical protein AMTR_s00018p00040800 [Amborella trichopoda]|uniref:Uncharacterized protein n=1 Tax=Amborella trichopoda TaxID=13333 RepID=W1PK47_AMBTC|nr:hypothetical protein AMTR_s00018p00040800 [Amborella trichopoda]
MGYLGDGPDHNLGIATPDILASRARNEPDLGWARAALALSLDKGPWLALVCAGPDLAQEGLALSMLGRAY